MLDFIINSLIRPMAEAGQAVYGAGHDVYTTWPVVGWGMAAVIIAGLVGCWREMRQW